MGNVQRIYWVHNGLIIVSDDNKIEFLKEFIIELDIFFNLSSSLSQYLKTIYFWFISIIFGLDNLIWNEGDKK